MVATLINVTLNIVLAIAGLMLFTLLVPVPRAIVRMTTGIISLLKGEQVVWVSRLLFLVLVAMVVGSYMTLQKYEDRKNIVDQFGRQEALQNKFRSERNFYLNYFTLVVVLTVWRVQHIFEYKDKLQSDVSELRKKIAAK